MTRSSLLRHAILPALLVTCFAGPAAWAAITPGAVLNFDAAADANGNAVWESTTAEQNFNWSFPGARNTTAVADPATPGITAAFDLPAARGTANTYSAAPLSADGGDATTELWFNPADLTDKHVLFETGGNGSGAVIELNGRTLTFTVQSNPSTRMTAATVLEDAAVGRFNQVLGTIDFQGGGAGQIDLYLNGQLAASDTVGGGFTSFAGGDNSGLGRIGGGSVAGIDNGINSVFSDFNGQVAINRFYKDQLLSASEVADNHDAVAAVAGPAPRTAHVFDNLTVNWDSTAPGAAPDSQWRANHIPDDTTLFAWNLSGGADEPMLQTGLVSEGTLITEAYGFTGGSGQAVTNDLLPNRDQDLSVEIWIDPADLMGQSIIAEAGGDSNGWSLLLDDDQLIFRVDQDSVLPGNQHLEASATLPAGIDEDFFQVFGTIDLGMNAIQLYVNGIPVAGDATAADLSSWAGGNAAAIGSANGTGINIGGTDSNDLDPFGTFDGLIGIARFYTGRVLTESEIVQNYRSLAILPVPEPGTAAMFALAGLALLRRRS